MFSGQDSVVESSVSVLKLLNRNDALNVARQLAHTVIRLHYLLVVVTPGTRPQ